MRLTHFLLILSLAVVFVGPARADDSDVVQVSPGVWMVTVKNRAGIFANAATTKRKAIDAANEFAANKGMDAVPVSMESVRAGFGPGKWPYVEYQFRLVPKGSNETVGLKPRGGTAIEVNPSTQSPVPVESQAEASASTSDLYAELIKLDDLRKRGLLTDAEFESQKAKLLAK